MMAAVTVQFCRRYIAMSALLLMVFEAAELTLTDLEFLGALISFIKQEERERVSETLGFAGGICNRYHHCATRQ